MVGYKRRAGPDRSSTGESPHEVWTALWAVYVIWGSTYLFIAITVETIPPLLAVSTRFIAAGAIMAAVVRAPRRVSCGSAVARSARAC